MGKQNIFQKVGFFVKDFFNHWNTPPKEGYYLPNKEFIAYSVGGMGVQGIWYFYSVFCNKRRCTSCARIQFWRYDSSIYDLDNRIAYAFPCAYRRLDNRQHQYQWGKYRPYLLFAGALSVVCYWMLAFIPDLFYAGQRLRTYSKNSVACRGYVSVGAVYSGDGVSVSSPSAE